MDLKERKRIKQQFNDNVEDVKQRKEKAKSKGKGKKKKITKEDINRYGPYFNYTPFEKSVIESKGKTPYNNHHVEIIANKGYD